MSESAGGQSAQQQHAAPTVDEILAALPAVAMRLVNLGEHTGADRWGAQISPADFKQYDIWDGQGETPVAALLAALKKAGIEVGE